MARVVNTAMVVNTARVVNTAMVVNTARVVITARIVNIIIYYFIIERQKKHKFIFKNFNSYKI